MSLDFGLMAKLIVDAFEKKEKYNDTIDDTTIIIFEDTKNNEQRNTKYLLIDILNLILSIILGFIAFYLSWSCNTALNYHILIKSIFAIFAFLFGFVYIILYFLFRWDTCSSILSKKN